MKKIICIAAILLSVNVLCYSQESFVSEQIEELEEIKEIEELEEIKEIEELEEIKEIEIKDTIQQNYPKVNFYIHPLSFAATMLYMPFDAYSLYFTFEIEMNPSSSLIVRPSALKDIFALNPQGSSAIDYFGEKHFRFGSDIGFRYYAIKKENIKYYIQPQIGLFYFAHDYNYYIEREKHTVRENVLWRDAMIYVGFAKHKFSSKKNKRISTGYFDIGVGYYNRPLKYDRDSDSFMIDLNFALAINL